MENEKSARIQIGVVTRPPPGGCGCYLDHDRTRVTWCPLHAAAPALLEALRRVTDYLEHHVQMEHDVMGDEDPQRVAVDTARAAIAKATD